MAWCIGPSLRIAWFCPPPQFSLRSWRYCVGARLKFWRWSRGCPTAPPSTSQLYLPPTICIYFMFWDGTSLFIFIYLFNLSQAYFRRHSLHNSINTVPQGKSKRICFSSLTYISTVLNRLPQGEWPLQVSHTIISGAPARAKRARSGAPWVRKFGKASIPENLVMT